MPTWPALVGTLFFHDIVGWDDWSNEVWGDCYVTFCRKGPGAWKVGTGVGVVANSAPLAPRPDVLFEESLIIGPTGQVTFNLQGTVYGCTEFGFKVLRGTRSNFVTVLSSVKCPRFEAASSRHPMILISVTDQTISLDLCTSKAYMSSYGSIEYLLACYYTFLSFTSISFLGWPYITQHPWGLCDLNQRYPSRTQASVYLVTRWSTFGIVVICKTKTTLKLVIVTLPDPVRKISLASKRACLVPPYWKLGPLKSSRPHPSSPPTRYPESRCCALEGPRYTQ